MKNIIWQDGDKKIMIAYKKPEVPVDLVFVPQLTTVGLAECLEMSEHVVIQAVDGVLDTSVFETRRSRVVIHCIVVEHEKVCELLDFMATSRHELCFWVAWAWEHSKSLGDASERSRARVNALKLGYKDRLHIEYEDMFCKASNYENSGTRQAYYISPTHFIGRYLRNVSVPTETLKYVWCSFINGTDVFAPSALVTIDYEFNICAVVRANPTVHLVLLPRIRLLNDMLSRLPRTAEFCFKVCDSHPRWVQVAQHKNRMLIVLRAVQKYARRGFAWRDLIGMLAGFLF